MTNPVVDGTRLLVVSRDSAILRPVWSVGESNGWEVELAADPWEAVDRAKSAGSLGALVLDLPRGSSEGLQGLRWLRRFRPALPIILIGDGDDHGRRQECIRMGARDYLSRPVDGSQLEMAIQSSLSKTGAHTTVELTSEDVEWVSNQSAFIGVSPVMRRLRAQAALLAETNVPVLIVGEQGSGKETVARLIHCLSVRSGFAFAKVNCAELPEDLLERELFGAGSEGTNSAAGTRIGKLGLCARGTIFLNEIDEMPGGLQTRMMTMLDKGRLITRGNSEFNSTEVRVLTATSKNVESAISASQLGEELYHRLCTYTIHVPPLRERREELILLARHFMHRFEKQYSVPSREFSPALVEAWQAYDWPGNLRELRHRVKRYLVAGDEELAHGIPIATADREAEGSSQGGWGNLKDTTPVSSLAQVGVPPSRPLQSLVKSVKADAERNAICLALEKTSWNRKAAARLLGVSYRTILYKIEQYGISAARSRAASKVSVEGFR